MSDVFELRDAAHEFPSGWCQVMEVTAWYARKHTTVVVLQVIK